MLPISISSCSSCALEAGGESLVMGMADQTAIHHAAGAPRRCPPPSPDLQAGVAILNAKQDWREARRIPIMQGMPGVLRTSPLRPWLGPAISASAWSLAQQPFGVAMRTSPPG